MLGTQTAECVGVVFAMDFTVLDFLKGDDLPERIIGFDGLNSLWIGVNRLRICVGVSRNGAKSVSVLD